MGCSCCSHHDDDCISGAPCGTQPSGGHDESSHDLKEGARARLETRLLAIRFAASALLFTAGLILNLLSGDRADSFFGNGLLAVWTVRSLFILSWLVAGYRVVGSAFRNVLRGDFFDENFLMSVATIGAFLIGQWSEGAAVMLFFNLGELVQESAVSRSRRSISDLMDVRPDMARFAADGREVHPSAVPAGSRIRVLPGEKVPLDGMIVEGTSYFDTSRLTGESVPREAEPGKEALAGFVNGSGLLVIRTTAVYAETAASKMLELIENAQNRKAKAEKLITSFARIYTPIVTVGALLLAVLPPVVLSVIGTAPLEGWQSFRPWVSRALVFLVISCPCAFVISVPLGFFGGIGGAAKKGILVKGADYIDALASAKAVVFDKTGTLTHGKFSVIGIEPSQPYGENDLALLAAAAESHSNHPVAVAIRAYATSLGLETDAGKIDRYAEHAGYGVSLVHDGRPLIAGSRALLEKHGVSGLPHRDASAVDGTVVALAVDGTYAGRLVLSDEPKPEAARAIRALESLGVRDTLMLTGDTESAAKSIAEKIGIANVRSGVLPHQKVSFFEEFAADVKKRHPKGTVLFVGDGINDAPVLARSDAGIAMGALGSDAAIEAADVVLMNDNPMLVATAISSARWTRHIVFENIALSFIVKIGFLALGAAGFATLWEAVFADVGVALLATLNSLRARR